MASPQNPLQDALEAYKAKMLASNRSTIEKFIHLLENEPGTPSHSGAYDSRLDYFARFLLSRDNWPEAYLGRRPPITTLSELSLAFPEFLVEQHLHLDGVIPPRSPQDQAQHLELLQEAINDKADTDESGPLILPDDYVSLLKLTDALFDADYRQQYVCEFGGVGSPVLAEELAERVPPRENLDLFEGCKVAGGWSAGGNGEGSACHYVYCKDENEAEGDGEEWGWKIIFLGANDEEPFIGDMKEFLDWYGDWEERDDVDTLLKKVLDRMKT